MFPNLNNPSFVCDCHCQDKLPEDNEDDYDYEPNNSYLNSVDKIHKVVSPCSTIMNDEKESGSKKPSKFKKQIYSPTIFSPLDSPKTPSPNIQSPKPPMHSNKKSVSVLRLSSTRVTDFTVPSSLPASPNLCTGFSISSADSDGEVIVCLKKLCFK